MFGKTPPANRTECLEKLNGILAAYGLPTWTEERLGDRAKGSPEIIDVIETRDESADRIVFDLLVAEPSGATRVEHVRLGGDAVVIVPCLTSAATGHRHVWMCRRWRVGRGAWSYELPHATIAARSPDPAHAAFAAAFGPDATAALGDARAVRLGSVIMPCRADDADAWLLTATVPSGVVARVADGEAVRVLDAALAPFVSGHLRFPDPVTHALIAAASAALSRA